MDQLYLIIRRIEIECPNGSTEGYYLTHHFTDKESEVYNYFFEDSKIFTFPQMKQIVSVGIEIETE